MFHAPLLAEQPTKKINLEGLDTDIGHTKQSLTQLERDYRREKQALQAVDKKLAVLRRDILRKGQEISTTQKRLKQLDKQQKRAKLSLKEQRQHIHTIIYNAYRHGNQSVIQLLLSPAGDSLAGIGRKMSYYQHLNQAHQKKIDTYLATLGHLQKLISDTNYQNNVLQRAKQQLTQLEQNNQRQSNLRNEKIKNIQHLTLTEQQNLRLLKDERKELERLLQDLTRINPELTQAPTDQQSFAELKRKLLWPINKKPVIIRHCFGDLRAKPRTKWDAVVLAVPDGTEVWAIYGGEVVFAEYLSSYGLLIVIKHSNDYMSLYGHNSVLLHHKGDQVQTGQMIARSGNSGTIGKPQLLFSITKKNTALNPLEWLKKRAFKRENNSKKNVNCA